MKRTVRASRGTPHDFLLALDEQIYNLENGVQSSSRITSESDIGVTADELEQYRDIDIEGCEDYDSLQDVIYACPDGILEDQLQQMYSQCVSDKDELDTCISLLSNIIDEYISMEVNSSTNVNASAGGWVTGEQVKYVGPEVGGFKKGQIYVVVREVDNMYTPGPNGLPPSDWDGRFGFVYQGKTDKGVEIGKSVDDPYSMVVGLDDVIKVDDSVNSSTNPKSRRTLVRGGRGTPIDFENALHAKIAELEGNDIQSSVNAANVEAVLASDDIDIEPGLKKQIQDLANNDPLEFIGFLKRALSPEHFDAFAKKLKGNITTSTNINAGEGPQTNDDLIELATQYGLDYEYDDAGNLIVRQSTADGDLEGFFTAAGANPSFVYEDYDGDYGVGFKGVQGVTNVMAADLSMDSDYINQLAEETVDWIANLGYQAGYQIQPDKNYLYFEVFDASDEVISTYLQPIADITPVPDDLYDDAKTLAEAILGDLPVEFANNEGVALDRSEAGYDKWGDSVSESTKIHAAFTDDDGYEYPPAQFQDDDKVVRYKGFTALSWYIPDNGENGPDCDTFGFGITDANGHEIDLGASGLLDGAGNLMFDMWDEAAIKDAIDTMISDGYQIENDFDMGRDHYGTTEFMNDNDGYTGIGPDGYDPR